ncbi:RND efflux system, membrane fusion protein [Pseudogulbenkiania sp. NH8B]|uniref:efflux RND transporter periplasmic adaptor subunit n=1 Tax=Pseudogulbenkiania sp. (strain NH8B) TaxID=748280 RepID=UPI0002279A5E|nr:HlyD family efflux transporter periplasmic adaptor subunit [Pseudogulbenkiania sp. NH8B]BAK77463.1 RND efflux system, membrane fusion protein [Pseudogulbenkiania sp. NH8B]
MGHADKSRELASLLQLLHRAREAVNVAQLGFIVVNESQQLLSYRQAALWREGVHRHVGALSGLAELDPTAPYMQWLGGVFRHVATVVDSRSSQVVSADDLPERLAAEWSLWFPEHALWLRLGGQGALLLARESAWSEYEVKLAEELAHGYGHALSLFLPRRNWREEAMQWLRPGSRQRKLLLVALLIVCLPIRLTVLARAEVVPQKPLLLRAPIAGVIDHIAVEPNQRVTQGAPLFDLDATALSGQYAMAARERDAAQESFRASAQLAVTDDKGKLAMAQDRAKLEEKSIAADYTGRELQRLHVTAPAAGVVVFSDRNDWQGKAVAVGEKVMTLADPTMVELAAWLPAAEAIDVAPGAKVTLYPNASPIESYDAEIIRVAYKAEAVEGGLLAYRLQARFVSGDKPRLGQMGTARVYGDWVPLIYYALRRPLTAARQWLGW